METMLINEFEYQVPSFVTENNLNSKTSADDLFLLETFMGQELYDRLDYSDFMESGLVVEYAQQYDLNEDDVSIVAVLNTMFAYYTNYEKKDRILVILEKAE